MSDTNTIQTSPAEGHSVLGPSAPGPIFGPAATISVWTVSLMFIAAFVTHVPPMHEMCPPSVVGPLLLSIMLVSLTMGLSRVPAKRGLIVGLVSAVLVGAMSLLIVGSMLKDPGATAVARGDVAATLDGQQSLKPDAATIVLGFMAACVVVGVIAGVLGAALSKRRGTQAVDARVWLGRLATAACVSVVPLLCLGGLVTSTGSGLAVPDWPGTYGANMFLYPVSLMTANSAVFQEHSHRLYGAMVGLTTLLLMSYSFVALRAGIDKRMPWFAVGLFVLVCLQGLLGGMRVTTTSAMLGLMHGVLAQAFFACMVAFAAALVINRGPLLAADRLRFGRKFSVVFLCIVMVQLVFGAMYRHKPSPHPLWSHVGWAFVVVVAGLVIGMWCKKFKAESRTLKRVGGSIEHPLMFQFLLGWVALFMALSAGPKVAADTKQVQADASRNVPTLSAAVRTVHQANGAVVLAGAVLAVVWTRRLSAKPGESTAVLSNA